MKGLRLPFAAVALATPQNLITTTYPESLLAAKLVTGVRS
jgi:hypothetical protein